LNIDNINSDEKLCWIEREDLNTEKEASFIYHMMGMDFAQRELKFTRLRQISDGTKYSI